MFDAPVAGRLLALRYSPLFWWPRPRLTHTAESALGSASGFQPSSERPFMRHPFITFHPRFTTAHPMSVITDHRRCTGVTITGYTIIVIAAVATDHTINAVACLIKFVPTASTAFANAYDSRPSPC